MSLVEFEKEFKKVSGVKFPLGSGYYSAFSCGCEAGQQSQQGEVNKLQTKISLLEKELTETQAFLNKQNHIKQVKINELQTRMEKLLDYAGTSGHTPNWIIKEFLK